jgi:hypothetical protein
MFEYVDLYMTYRPNGLKYVILNVYGGESLHHPDIVTILQAVQQCYEKYKANWHLTVTTTTNAIISSDKLAGILPLIDEFTVSYHVENSTKNKKLFRNNLLTIKAAGRRQKCVVLMHPEPDFFEDCKNIPAKAIINRSLPNRKRLILPVLVEHAVVVDNCARIKTTNKKHSLLITISSIGFVV